MKSAPQIKCILMIIIIISIDVVAPKVWWTTCFPFHSKLALVGVDQHDNDG